MKKQNIKLVAVALAIAFAMPGVALALVSYPAGSLLQPGDVTGTTIRANTITDTNINSSAGVQLSKLGTSNDTSDVLFGGPSAVATSSNLQYNSATSKLYVKSGEIDATSTNFNGVTEAWPSADGQSNQVLTANGNNTLSWTSPSASYIAASFTAGQSLTAGQTVAVLPYPANNISFDTNVSASGSGTTITRSFTVGNNSNRVLLVAANSNNGSTYTISGITYNGVSMTLLSRQSSVCGSQTGNSLEIWYLLAPATGANNLVITSNNSGNSVNYEIYSYYNVAQSTPGTFTSGEIGSGAVTLSTTTLVNGSLVFATAGNTFNGLSGTMETNNTLSISNCTTSGDSGALYPPQTVSLTFTANSNSDAVDAILVPVSASATSRVYKTTTTISGLTNSFIGIAQSSVSAGVSVNVAVAGIDSNQSGLSLGSHYYLSDTAGAISTTPGTFTREACIAVSATSCDITNIW